MSISLLGNLKVFDLTQLIEMGVEVYVPVAEESNQTLIVADGESKMKLRGDADLLMQMLANLIENSIRHCPAQTVIRIESGQSKKGMWVCVSANAPGVQVLIQFEDTCGHETIKTQDTLI